MPAVVAFDRVSKRYRLGASGGSLRERLAGWPKRFGGRGAEPDEREFWALRDVSFAVERGEVLGLIGPNGAGKTTSLKLLSGVTRPTSGSVHVNGRLSALIELGAGFHPELTGRENVFLNGAILGLSRADVQARFDSIVAFAELERFLDTPVKRYSSGMYVRLGFAVAIHVDPEILLVDEVLAVGDIAFQRKCLDRIKAIRRAGATVLFVSHHMRTMESLCDRIVWLEQGRVRESGDVKVVVAAYTDAMNERGNLAGTRADGSERAADSDVVMTRVRVVGDDGRQVESLDFGSSLTVEVSYRANRPVIDPSVDLAIFAGHGPRVCTLTTRLSGFEIARLEGEGVVRCRIDSLPLTSGRYSIVAAIFDREDLMMYDQWNAAASFVVRSRALGNTRWQLTQEEHGVLYLAPDWALDAEPVPEPSDPAVSATRR